MNETLIESISKLSLTKGDTLVIKAAPGAMDRKFFDNILEYLKKVYGESAVGLMVISDDSEISVLSKPEFSLKVKKEDEDATIPFKGSVTAVGWDLFMPKNRAKVFIAPGESVKVNIGLSVEIPEGSYGAIHPRSSAYAKDIDCKGIIDSDYRGPIFINFHNIGKSTVILDPGVSYAQLLVLPHNSPRSLTLTHELSTTERNQGGFGSSGNT